MLVGEGYARVDQLAGEEDGAGFFGRALEGEVWEGCGGGVGGQGAEVEVGCGALDLGEDEVVLGGGVLFFLLGMVVGGGGGGWGGGRGWAYAVRVVLYPHGVFVGVGYEGAGDGWHDVGGGDVAEAGAQAQRVF